MQSFTHLHVHSQYSLLDSTIKVPQLCKSVVEMGMDSVALTDSGNLFAAVEFYKAAKAASIKPIIGAETYYLSQGDLSQKGGKNVNRFLCNLLLLAQDRRGYENLCHLLSEAQLKGFYYKPRIDIELLKKYNSGLIAISGTLTGELHKLLLDDKLSAIDASANRLKEIFDDRIYLEIQDHGLPKEAKIREALIDVSRNYELPLVATNDCHYLKPEDRTAHLVLRCIQLGRTLQEEEDRATYSSNQMYLRSPEEMSTLFKDLPEAISNTQQVQERCQFEFELGKYFFPKYETPAGTSIEDLLKLRSKEGLEQRWEKISEFYEGAEFLNQKTRYKERLEEELAIILQMGFAAYFIIVADFIQYAKDSSIPVGPGRGSAAGSLVAYSLGITDINPIPFDLLFERFLNPERISMPDVDIDFCMNGRDRVIQYVSEKYHNVAQIITFGTLKAKAVIRDVGRVLDIPYSDVDRIAKLVPNTLNIKLQEAIDQEAEFMKLAKSDPLIEQLLEIALVLEGICRHASTHAAGVVIGDQALTHYTALYRGAKDEVVCQYDMKSVEEIGLIKFDFLGLKTLTILEEACRLIRESTDRKVDLNGIPLNDVKVYEKLSEGDGLAVFQLESSGMRELLKKLKPSRFEDLIALVALYRPGPLGSGMVDDFINRKHGKTKVKYDLAQLEPILQDTYGVIVYQEQVMKISSTLANYSLGEADLLRRAMGKKKLDVMAQQRKRFLEGSQENSIDTKKAEKIFDLMTKFAEYGFNKSHSAAYALVSYQTAYLKTHFPVQFMAAVLTYDMHNTDKILIYIQDCKRMSIELLGPDVNESERNFSVTSDLKIRYGLAAIKGVGDAAIDSIVGFRKDGEKFEDLFHFAEWVDTSKVNKKVFESLVKGGAFDSLNEDRAVYFKAIEEALKWSQVRQSDRSIGQASMFDMLPATSARPVLPRVESWSEKQKLVFEKEAVGFYFSSHPLDNYKNQLERFSETKLVDLIELEKGKTVKVCGMISSSKVIQTKRGKTMAFLTLQDFDTSVEVVIFPKVYEKVFRHIQDEDVVVLTATLEKEEDSDVIKLLADDLANIELMTKLKTKKIHLNLSKDIVDRRILDQIKNILIEHPGDVPVYLNLIEAQKTQTRLALPATLSISPDDEFVQKVERVFGMNCINYL